jgi:hypothetical protein
VRNPDQLIRPPPAEPIKASGHARPHRLIVEVLTARQPMVFILKSPFLNPASTAGTSFTPDMSNPSRRERDDED